MMHSERTLRWTLIGGVIGSVMGLFIGTYILGQHYTGAFEIGVEGGLVLGLVMFGIATVRFDLKETRP